MHQSILFARVLWVGGPPHLAGGRPPRQAFPCSCHPHQRMNRQKGASEALFCDLFIQKRVFGRLEKPRVCHRFQAFQRSPDQDSRKVKKGGYSFKRMGFWHILCPERDEKYILFELWRMRAIFSNNFEFFWGVCSGHMELQQRRMFSGIRGKLIFAGVHQSLRS